MGDEVRSVRMTEVPVDVVRTVGFDWIEVRTNGTATIMWSNPVGYTIPTGSGPVVHGGMITMLADSAMAWCLYGLDEPPEFLTGDLRTEFIRAVPLGPVIAHGSIVRRTRKVIFAEAEVRSVDGAVLYAVGRATQVVLDGTARFTVPGLR